MIQINCCGGPHADYSCRLSFDYHILFSKPMTVKKFIKEYLKEYPEKLGVFMIKKPGSYYGELFGDPELKYKEGKIIGEPFPKDILDKEIHSIWGRGSFDILDLQFDINN